MYYRKILHTTKAHIDRALARLIQLKRYTRSDDLIMLVWRQGSTFHIAAGSHPVQEAWGQK